MTPDLIDQLFGIHEELLTEHEFFIIIFSQLLAGLLMRCVQGFEP